MAVAEALKHLRKASSDSEKIAALLLVSKVVRAGEVSEEDRRQIFTAVGFSFVNRLLNTKDDSEDSSVSVSQSLAVTLLACFATDPQLATHSQVTSKIPLLLTFIAVRSSQPHPEALALQEDSLQVLLSLTCSPLGLHLLLASGCPQAAARALVAGVGHTAAVRQLLVRVLGQAAVVARHREEAAEAVGILAAEFRGNQDELKFELCSILCSVLSAVGEVLVQHEPPWLCDIAAGLYDILSSRIRSAQREAALLLSAQLCQMNGVQWTLTLRESKLFRLLANLASVEVQLCLEDDVQGGGLEGLEAVAPSSKLLCGCCVVLETSVVFTAMQTQLPDSQRVLTEEGMLQLHSSFTEAFRSIARFLSSRCAALPIHNPLVLAAVRVLGAWLAEESLALTPELLNQLLPRLLHMCEAHLQHCRQQSAPGEKKRQEEVGREELTDSGEGSLQEQCMEDPLKFLLPGLSHLVADDAPRAILMEARLPQLLLHYMTDLYSSGWPLTRPEAVSSFALSVEVLLTVSVCEVGLRGGEVFSHVARLLSRLLAAGCCDIRLSLQAALLWLMVAREQGQERASAQCCDVLWSDLWQKIAAVLLTALQLCPEATTADQPQPSPAREGWEPLAELWLLAMREMTIIAGSRPDVRELLLSSECVAQLAALSPPKHNQEEQQVLVATSQLMDALHRTHHTH